MVSRPAFILYGCDHPGCSFNSPTLWGLGAHTATVHHHDTIGEH